MAEHSIKYWKTDGSSHTVGGFKTQKEAETYARTVDRDPATPIRIHEAVEIPHRPGMWQAHHIATIEPAA